MNLDSEFTRSSFYFRQKGSHRTLEGAGRIKCLLRGALDALALAAAFVRESIQCGVGGREPMSAKVMMDVEEYLRTSFDGADCEYLDGEVVERNMGELPRGDFQDT
jgi:hypothetical protein